MDVQPRGNYGRVVATDLDIEELQGLDEPNLEVHKHDVVSDPLPERVFHLVHARLVLGGSLNAMPCWNDWPSPCDRTAL